MRIIRLSRILGGILFLGLLDNAVQTLNAAPDSYSVGLAWDGSPSPGIAGYRLYYGVVSGNYSNSVVLGNVTTDTLPGLAAGVTNFFAVTSYDTNGVESAFSNEITFVPGLPSVRISITADGQAVITVQGLIGHTYDIQATQDFIAWTVIGSVTLDASGSLDFTDTNTPSVSPRFYRTHDELP